MEQFWVAARWLDLAIHMTKPQKWHSHTYTPRPPPKLGPPLVPLRQFAELKEAGWGQDWPAGSSSFWLSWSFFCRSCGCPSGWRGCEIAATFITNISWCDGSWANVCSSYDQSYTDVIFRILVGRDKLFWHSGILIMRFVLREPDADVDFWLSKWKILVHVSSFGVRNIYLSLCPEIKNGISYPAYIEIVPLSYIASLTWRSLFKIYYLKVKIDCVG